jgi:hypothetical protein
MRKLNLWSSDVEQICRHIDLEHSIYDEDYRKTNVLCGIFSFIHKFTLRHSVYDTPKPKSEYRETSVPGFRKKVN